MCKCNIPQCSAGLMDPSEWFSLGRAHWHMVEPQDLQVWTAPLLISKVMFSSLVGYELQTVCQSPGIAWCWSTDTLVFTMCCSDPLFQCRMLLLCFLHACHTALCFVILVITSKLIISWSKNFYLRNTITGTIKISDFFLHLFYTFFVQTLFPTEFKINL
jgi:hypothetical protein